MTTNGQQAFIDSIAELVKRYAPQYGIKVISPIIAQAINESDWGTSDLGLRHNYFGMKTRDNWKGERYGKITQEEYEPGKVVDVWAYFRVYGSREAGVKGYFEFLFDPYIDGLYDNLKGLTDPYAYCQTIKADGYCTRTNYVPELMELIAEHNLTRYDDQEEGDMGIIQRKIVAPGHGGFTAPNPQFLAVHSTGNLGTSAYNHTVFWARPASQKGGQDYAVHVVSDWVEAFQCVEYDRKCWQVGNGNPYCIGIEICEAANKDDFLKGMEIARKAIWEMLHMKGWDVSNIRSHKWFTENYGGSDHIDPIPYLNKWGWTWEKFLDYLREGEEDMLSKEEIAQAVWERPWGDKMMGQLVRETHDEVVRTDDPTGRGQEMTTHSHVKWFAPLLQNINEKLAKNDELLEKIAKKVGVS